MRKHFVNLISNLALEDKDIILLSGDLGYPFLDEFKKDFPTQFINCGCIEQSMLGIAAGLALAGKKPYVYSNSNFLIFRAYEQLRNDICYQNLNVKLIGIQGRQYNFLGESHNLQPGEEKAMFKNLPNISVCIPKTPKQLENIIKKSYETKRPTYIRI